MGRELLTQTFEADAKAALLALPRAPRHHGLKWCDACKKPAVIDDPTYVCRKIVRHGYVRKYTKLWWVCESCRWALTNPHHGMVLGANISSPRVFVNEIDLTEQVQRALGVPRNLLIQVYGAI